MEEQQQLLSKTLCEENEIAHFLFPEAPPPKEKISLTPGTSEAPPPNIKNTDLPARQDVQEADITNSMVPLCKSKSPYKRIRFRKDLFQKLPNNTDIILDAPAMQDVQNTDTTNSNASNYSRKIADKKLQGKEVMHFLLPDASPKKESTSPAKGKKKVRGQKVADKTILNVLTTEQKERLFALREQKEVVRFLLPDAPEKKQKRKKSPARIPCPLTPDTPPTPPLPKPRIGATESVVEKPPAKRPRKLAQFSPSTGTKLVEAIQAEGVVVDARIELIGFSPTSGTSTIPDSNTSTPKSLPAVTKEPSLFGDPEEMSFECQNNTGSDVDDDLLDTGTVDIDEGRCRNVNDYPADLFDISPEHLHQLHHLDAEDDSALRAMAGNEDLMHFAWSSDPKVFTGAREDFHGPSGPTFPVESVTPLDIFERIWDEAIIEHIIKETNRYAFQLFSQTNLTQQSRMRRWTDVTRDELWTFFGIIMLHSFVPNPVEKEYWYPLLPDLQIGNIKNRMSFRRFLLIKKCLHFVDNTSITEQSTGEQKKLKKIQPILNHLNDKFSSLYLPEQNIAIDESLLLWKGRLSFSQLIATKAAQVGIKSYELCESRTGYLWKMEVYAGKSHDVSESVDPERGLNEPEGATSQIVYRLVRPLLDKGYTLVMDNFYNSPLLSRTLKSRKTDTIGTLRLNRQFVPDSLRSKTKLNMRTGEVASSQTQDLTIVVWKDNNLVSLISTYHKVEISGKEKHGVYKYKPQVVLDYNLAMGGVDKKDQLLQAYPVERIRNLVWYKKLFRRLLNVSIHNSYVIYNCKTNISQRLFRVQLADQILKKYNPQLPTPAQVPKTGHFPTRTNKRTRCKLCAKSKLDVRTPWACDTCLVSLCIDGCFKRFHISS
ncbi:piggyBac transposable element-derived protein 4-like isoform X2 [Ostrinia furnacalis]|uniref:piggyBac transposable element-derived protein 4-like isoform X2 n=1 Tax=Ostrinia furnacalis TaxID=93504 RepID=UPI0010392075|nr:piggyBac transposable element-derived protein 4-like isoform X2 [Ostrinia furnacalis]